MSTPQQPNPEKHSPSWVKRTLRDMTLATGVLTASCSGGPADRCPPEPDIQHIAHLLPPEHQGALRALKDATHAAVARLVAFESETMSLRNVFNAPQKVDVTFTPPRKTDADAMGAFSVHILRRNNNQETVAFPEIASVYRAWKHLQKIQDEDCIKPRQRFGGAQLSALLLAQYQREKGVDFSHDPKKSAEAQFWLKTLLIKPMRTIEEMQMPAAIAEAEQRAIDAHFTRSYHTLVRHLAEHHMLDEDWVRHMHIDRNDIYNGEKMIASGYLKIAMRDGAFACEVQRPSSECMKALQQETPRGAQSEILDAMVVNAPKSELRGASSVTLAVDLSLPLGMRLPFTLTIENPDAAQHQAPPRTASQGHSR